MPFHKKPEDFFPDAKLDSCVTGFDVAVKALADVMAEAKAARNAGLSDEAMTHFGCVMYMLARIQFMVHGFAGNAGFEEQEWKRFADGVTDSILEQEPV